MARWLLCRCLVTVLLAALAPSTARAAAPAAPSGLAGRVLSGTQISLTWADRSSNETAFAVWRQVDGGTWAVLVKTAPNVRTTLDQTVSAGHSYGYRVRATNADGASAWSNTITLSVPRVYPAAPTGLIVAPKAGRLELAWTDQSHNETAFAVWRQEAGGAWSRIGVTPPNTDDFVDQTVSVPVSDVQQPFWPFAVDRQAVAFGREVSFALSPVAQQHFWRITVPAATAFDLDWMLRDGVLNLATVGDILDLHRDTGAIAAQIQAAVNTRIALSLADPTYQADTILNHHPDNPRVVLLPLVETVADTTNSGDPQRSRMIGTVRFWLTGSSLSELRGTFVSQTLPAASPRLRYRVRATNNFGASEWSNEVAWPPSVVSGTAPLF